MPQRGKKHNDGVTHHRRFTKEVNNFSIAGVSSGFASPGGQTHLVLGYEIVCRFSGNVSGLGGFRHRGGRGNGLGGEKMRVV
jgi:hypothetical protein